MLVNNVKIASNTTGTGAITLGVAVPGYRGVEALANGVTYSYAIGNIGSQFEFGHALYLSSGTQLIRSPLGSSDGGTAINLPAGAIVNFTALADDYAAKSTAQTIAGSWRIRAGTSCPNTGQNTFLAKEVHFYAANGTTILSVGGTAIASGYDGTATPAKAFDNDSATYWESQGYRSEFGMNTWIGYQFAAPVAPFSFDLKVFYANSGPMNLILDYAPTNTYWLQHSQHFPAVWVADTYQTFAIPAI
jgi:hypothetical protein